jgi:FixJ family two-component response regulator
MNPTVHVVDDDAAVRGGLEWFFESAGLTVAGYASAEEFLERYEQAPDAECVVLDFSMPGLNGIELFERFTDNGWTLPAIFLTGHGTVPTAVQALKYGAFDFLEKPFADEELL